MEKDFRAEIGALVQDRKQAYTAMSDRIWGFAEPRFQEYDSSRLQQEYLKARGFSIRADLAGEETAFIAEYGSGKPVLAFLGEFDALSSLEQEADSTERRPVPGKTNGHGCGHHLLGTAAVAAADALKTYMESHGLLGTIRYYGCPAEENAGGKAYLVRDGFFNDCDAAITWHPSTTNKTMMADKYLSNFRVFFTFHGISSHAAGAPELGRSALDAVEIMDIGVNYMREHVISDARIHYAYLDNGGEAPNVVQDHASLLYFMRAPKLAQSSEILARIKKIAQGAALMTETEVKVRVLGGLSDVIPNPTAFQVLSDAYVEMGGPEFDEEDYAIARKFLAILPEDAKKAMVQKMAVLHKMTPEEFEKRPLNSVVIPYSPLMRQKVLTASSDVGDVSYLVPTAQLTASAAIPGTGHHTWQYTAQVGTSIGGKACLAAAKAIGLACTRIFDDPALADQAKKELLEETGGVYVSPIPDDLTYVDAM